MCERVCVTSTFFLAVKTNTDCDRDNSNKKEEKKATQDSAIEQLTEDGAEKARATETSKTYRNCIIKRCIIFSCVI